MGGVPQLPDRRLAGNRHWSLWIVHQHSTELNPGVTTAEAASTSSRRELPGVPLAKRQKPPEPD